MVPSVLMNFMIILLNFVFVSVGFLVMIRSCSECESILLYVFYDF